MNRRTRRQSDLALRAARVVVGHAWEAVLAAKSEAERIRLEAIHRRACELESEVHAALCAFAESTPSPEQTP